MAPEGRTFHRSRDRWIAGVCGGIAEWLGWSPGRVRIAYVVVSILSAAFPGILVYVVLWFVIPGPDDGANPTA
jgi:phage shock protein C